MRFLNHSHNKQEKPRNRENTYSRIPTPVSAQGARFRPAMLLAMMLTISCLLLIDSQLCYAITVNGETVGTTRDRSEANEIVENAELRVSEIFGYDYSIEDEVSVSAWLGSAENSSGLETAILSNLKGIVKLDVLYVDGKAVGAAEDGSVILELTDAILEKYKNESTVSAGFVQDVNVRHAFVNDDIIQDMDELAALLDPENDASEFSLDVGTVELCERVEALGYETEYYDSENVHKGESVVVKQGVDGEQLVNRRSVLLNGMEVSSTILSASTVTEPVNEVIAVGISDLPTTVSTGSYIWPCAGTVTSNYGNRSVNIGSSNHKGLDIAAGHGTEIYAADGGEVILSEYYYGYGNTIQILHDNGDITYYAHCSSLAAEVGERVAQGELIAYMGATGTASGTHLHFEVRPGGGEPVDPMNYLPEA